MTAVFNRSGDVRCYGAGRERFAFRRSRARARLEMDKTAYSELIREYRRTMEGLDLGDAWMDWRSDVYVNGMWECARIADARLPGAARVLDVGCGMGLMAVLLKGYGHDVRGVDIDAGGGCGRERAYGAEWGSCGAERERPTLLTESWEEIRKVFGISLTGFDGRSLPFGDGAFDAVVAHAVIEHVNPDWLGELLAEISRVTRDGGWFFVFRTPRQGAYLERLAARLGLPVHELVLSERQVEKDAARHGLALVREGVTDMVPSFPPKGMRFYNLLSPLLTSLDRLLLRSPLKKYAHHMALVFQKGHPGVG